MTDSVCEKFVDIGNRECYVGMLYACYDLIRPDVILELSWRHGLNDFTMPYLINLLSNQTRELATLKADNEARKAREKEQEKVDDNTPILGGNRLMITAGPGGGVGAGVGGTMATGTGGLMGAGGLGRASPAPFAQTNGFAAQPTGYGY
jgi:clathrin heavy chain